VLCSGLLAKLIWFLRALTATRASLLTTERSSAREDGGRVSGDERGTWVGRSVVSCFPGQGEAEPAARRLDREGTGPSVSA
jgi:hypothetical protein